MINKFPTLELTPKNPPEDYRKFTDDLMPNIGILFNKVHKLSEPEIYWRVLLHPMITLFVEQLVYRKSYLNSETHESKQKDKLYVGGIGILHQNETYYRVLRNILSSKVPDSKALNRGSESIYIRVFRVLRGLKSLSCQLINLIPFLVKVNLALRKKIVLCESDAQRRVLARIDTTQYHYVTLPFAISFDQVPNFLLMDIRRTTISLQLDQDGDIIENLERLLPKVIPLGFLEFFSFYRWLIRRSKISAVVFQSASGTDEFRRLVLAHCRKSRLPVIIPQHGGGFRITAGHDEWYDRAMSSTFISYNDYKGFEPQFFVDRFELVQDSESILVCAPKFKDHHRYNAGLQPHDNLKVTSSICTFISSQLNSGCMVYYRAYGGYPDEIVKQFDKAKSFIPLNSDNWLSHVRKVGVVVCCKSTTVVNDVINQGVLPVLFFDLECEGINANYYSEFYRLNSMGYWFNNPVDLLASTSDKRKFRDSTFVNIESLANLFYSMFGRKPSPEEEGVRILSELKRLL